MVRKGAEGIWIADYYETFVKASEQPHWVAIYGIDSLEDALQHLFQWKQGGHAFRITFIPSDGNRETTELYNKAIAAGARAPHPTRLTAQGLWMFSPLTNDSGRFAEAHYMVQADSTHLPAAICGYVPAQEISFYVAIQAHVFHWEGTLIDVLHCKACKHIREGR